MRSANLRGILELIGAAAVLVGLLFVGLELRQNTEAVQASSLQSQTDASTEFLMLIASDEDLARIWRDASSKPDELSEIDRVRFFLISRARWLRMQNAYLQWRRGTLSDEDWTLYNGLICSADPESAMRFSANWDEHRSLLTGGFVEFVENCWSSEQAAGGQR